MSSLNHLERVARGLLIRGVAPRKVARALDELREHLEDLTEEGRAAASLGDPELLANELARAHRWTPRSRRWRCGVALTTVVSWLGLLALSTTLAIAVTAAVKSATCSASTKLARTWMCEQTLTKAWTSAPESRSGWVATDSVGTRFGWVAPDPAPRNPAASPRAAVSLHLSRVSGKLDSATQTMTLVLNQRLDHER